MKLNGRVRNYNKSKKKVKKMENEKIINAALKMYKKHQEIMKKYHSEHPDKVREASKKYITKMKLEQPERYEAIKLKNRERYQRLKANKVIAIEKTEILL